ncbi:hypothetical protein P4V47_08040 [Brevibacillus laterosporus]|uniref:hypothetical protein n=1 Tax=Brevibacillus laterosporus TaxID=1465 RepID=UPI001EF29652|nr:hypothetical protein [Brevibacillus laterosporus]MED1787456.1 hypothetical protein [Brevibacillus laterosporus]
MPSKVEKVSIEVSNEMQKRFENRNKQSVGRVNSNTLFVYATVYRFVCQAEMSDKLHPEW